MSPDAFVSRPNPARAYAESVRRIEALQALDTPQVNPLCRTNFMTHGVKVGRAVLLLHGLTNCPRGFQKLGEAFHAQGCNVLIPRAPHNGLADRLTDELAQVTAEKLVAFTDEAVDIAQGLGEHVTVAGISMAGNMTAWAATHRADVDLAVIVAPALGLRAAPSAVTRMLVRLALWLPNVFLWWDPRYKANIPGPSYTYPRISTHALAETYRLGMAVQTESRRAKPAAQSVLVITNAADASVNNAAAARLVGCWRANGTQNLRTYEFAASLKLPHDIISPEKREQRVDLVYPILIDLMSQRSLAEF